MIAVTQPVRSRIEFGRKLRHRLKRSDHARWSAADRKEDPVEIIVRSNRDRIPQLVPIKMARMAASPFVFFRGNVPVMEATFRRRQLRELKSRYVETRTYVIWARSRALMDV